MQRMKALLAVSVVAVSAAVSRAEEWPKWLGPEGTGISTDPIADKWPEGGPRRLWEQKVGLGYSSPIGFEGKVYLFSQKGDRDALAAYDAKTGARAWSQTYAVTIPADQGQAKDPENGLPLPLATPTIDHGRIFTYGGGGDLVCRSLDDGKELWHANILTDTGSHILAWNESSSPLVTDKFVYVQGGKGGPTAVAVDRNTGKIAWQSEAKTVGGYAAPILADVGGTPQLIIFGGDHLYGMDPASGRTIWGVPWKTSYDVNAATPLYHDGHLFISSDYGHGSMMLTLSPSGAKEDWDKDDKDLMLKFQPPILDHDYLYANSGGVIKCMHWPDGKIAWECNDRKLRLGEGGSIVRDGDKLIAMSERGRLSLVKATPEGCQLVSQVQLFDFGATWATPLIYQGRLYAMGKDTLVCLDVSSATARGVEHGGTAVANAVESR